MTNQDPPIPESLNDFPASSQVGGGSPARSWDPKGKKNLLIVIGVIAFACMIMVLLFTGGKKEVEKPSALPEAVAPNETGMLSEEDSKALKTAEKERLHKAQVSGTSAIENQNEMPDLASDLARQKANRANPSIQPINDGRLIYPEPVQKPRATVDDARLKGFTEQMTALQNAWGMGSTQTGATTGDRRYIREVPKQQQPETAAAAQAAAANTDPGRIFAPAFDPVYTATMLNSFDSDTPGLIRGRILTGPLVGAVLKGAGQRMGEGARISFTEASFQGKTFKINAIALDEKTSSDVVQGRYDGRYAQRFVFPILAEGVKAFATARAQTGTQVVAINIPGIGGAGGVTATGAQQAPPPTVAQARDAMIAGAAAQTQKALASGPQEGQVILDMRQSFGVMFIEPVYESDLAGNAKKAGA